MESGGAQGVHVPAPVDLTALNLLPLTPECTRRVTIREMLPVLDQLQQPLNRGSSQCLSQRGFLKVMNQVIYPLPCLETSDGLVHLR